MRPVDTSGIRKMGRAAAGRTRQTGHARRRGDLAGRQVPATRRKRLIEFGDVDLVGVCTTAEPHPGAGAGSVRTRVMPGATGAG
ncbi:hypothetical protein AB0C38_48650 [Amycolatopsis sp. NPDC048633]|uniref:hypothetical protein n=1 Tax=Amycolatopsis sp. NPDC048633 TaxID=3157095 RepID=UPI003404E0C4